MLDKCSANVSALCSESTGTPCISFNRPCWHWCFYLSVLMVFQSPVAARLSSHLARSIFADLWTSFLNVFSSIQLPCSRANRFLCTSSRVLVDIHGLLGGFGLQGRMLSETLPKTWHADDHLSSRPCSAGIPARPVVTSSTNCWRTSGSDKLFQSRIFNCFCLVGGLISIANVVFTRKCWDESCAPRMLETSITEDNHSSWTKSFNYGLEKREIDILESQ